MARLNAQAARKLRETCGLTLTQWRIVLVIGNSGRITQAELSRLTDVDKGQISRAVHVLQEMDVVRATSDPSDQRMSWLTLTENGQSKYDETYPVMVDRQASLMAAFSPEEQDAFYDGLDKIKRAVEADV